MPAGQYTVTTVLVTKAGGMTQGEYIFNSDTVEVGTSKMWDDILHNPNLQDARVTIKRSVN